MTGDRIIITAPFLRYQFRHIAVITINTNAPVDRDMGNDGKTELQREILLTWYDNPNATNKEIAEACDCSASYVSDVKNRFDDYNHFEAMMDREDKQMEQMFGDRIFSAGGPSINQPASTDQPGLAETWEDLPNNPAGLIIKGIILVVLLFVAYQIAFTLF